MTGDLGHSTAARTGRLVLAALVFASAVFALHIGTAAAKAFLPTRGVWASFEKRNWPNGYYNGDVIQSFNTFDDAVGRTVSAEVSAQLDAMKAMGLNTISFELGSSDPTYTGKSTPPDCNVSKLKKFSG